MKQIEGYKYYYITKEGQVFNKRRNRNMCTWKDNVGYIQVNLYKEGKKKYMRIHRLVAKYFVPNPENKPIVNHIDGDKTNNHYTNLEWVDNSENVQHYYNSGGNTNVKAVEVVYPCGITVVFPTVRETARQLNINRKTLSSILNGEKENNTNYVMRYREKGVETIESIPSLEIV